MPSGRPRSLASQKAILAATVELLEEGGWGAMSVEGIAARARVGKQTIYRWYGGDLGRLVVEAFIGASDERLEPPDTGSVREDLVGIVVPVARRNLRRDRGTALANRSLMAHAQANDEFAATYRTLHEHWREPMLEAVRRGIRRGELREDVDPHLLVDLLLGLQWYRLLVGHRRVTGAQAAASVDTVLAGSMATG
ncbi:TetR/AcrR family transcriptional regulator [Nocardioides mangrovi]|uniref:TetR/AcrR family transcriptional regulator n=1 Tax=Nocardioides mangrovi TaxID=2874580 RepID=A0ABS7U9C3_9ACTN|nr:TetR/AcrR family transcriptional regulator [Nocardioides mangrovi]MBZ5737467.1 TetR/AcrR family transcriptional regulator [Nocardioides mangrovi]